MIAGVLSRGEAVITHGYVTITGSAVTIAEPCSSYTLCLHFLIERGVSPVNCQYTAQQGHCRDLQTDLELGSYRRTMYCNGGFDVLMNGSGYDVKCWILSC